MLSYGWRINPFDLLPKLNASDEAKMWDAIYQQAVTFYENYFHRKIPESELFDYQKKVVIAMRLGGCERVAKITAKFHMENNALMNSRNSTGNSPQISTTTAGGGPVIPIVGIDELCDEIRERLLKF